MVRIRARVRVSGRAATRCCVRPVRSSRHRRSRGRGHGADAGARSSLHLGDSSLERRTAGSMSGWGDTLIGSKFEAVVDQSTGETIMVSTPARSLPSVFCVCERARVQPGMHAATARPSQRTSRSRRSTSRPRSTSWTQTGTSSTHRRHRAAAAARRRAVHSEEVGARRAVALHSEAAVVRAQVPVHPASSLAVRRQQLAAVAVSSSGAAQRRLRPKEALSLVRARRRGRSARRTWRSARPPRRSGACASSDSTATRRAT